MHMREQVHNFFLLMTVYEKLLTCRKTGCAIFPMQAEARENACAVKTADVVVEATPDVVVEAPFE